MDKKARIKVGIIGLILLIGIFGCYFVMAQGESKTSYDKTSKVITINDSGKEIAKITLDTNLNEYIMRGINRTVAEFTIENLEYYSKESINDIDLYDKKNNMNEFNRKVYYRYKSYYEVNVTGQICKEGQVWDEMVDEYYTKYDCVKDESNSHMEKRFEWIDFDEKADLPKGNITIGIVTDVLPNEHVEWIPTLFGEKIEEWAEWTESLNVDLWSYWTFNESSGTTIDNVLGNASRDGVFENDNSWVTGLIGNALDFNQTGSATGEYANITTDPFAGYGGDFSMSWWEYRPPAITHPTVAWGYYKSGVTAMQMYSYTTKYCVGWSTNGAGWASWGTLCVTPPSTSSWQHLVLTRSGNNWSIYKDGTIAYSEIVAGVIWDSSDIFTLGKSQSSFYNGSLEEFGIWKGRGLSGAEVTQLYNEGNGITYGIPPAADETPPNVTLNTPLNQTYNTKTIYFNVTALDETEMKGCNFTLNDGFTNYTMTNSSSSPTYWNATNYTMRAGGIEVIYDCWDASGNLNHTEEVSINIRYPINYTGNVTQQFTTSSATDKTRSLEKDISQPFTPSTLISRIGNFFKILPQLFTLNALTDRLSSITKLIRQSLTFSALVDRITSLSKIIYQSFTINVLTERAKGFLSNIQQTFTINSFISAIISQVRNPIQSISVSTLMNYISTIAKRISTDYFKIVINYPASLVERIASFLRNPFQNLNINIILDRILSFFRKLFQAINLEAIVERIRRVLRLIFQFFQMLFKLLTSGTFGAWNWITSTETLNQYTALENIPVPWGINDTWVVSAASPENFTDVNKTYTLPNDCSHVNFWIDGVNATLLVNNTGCIYTLRNNNTLEPTNISIIDINYSTTAIDSSEGSWLAYNKRVGNQTRWRNTLTTYNPSLHDYVNFSINITSDKVAINESLSVVNSTDDVFVHTFDLTNGNVNWSLLDLYSKNTSIFTIDYNTTEINLTSTEHNQTILGKVYEVHNITISANSTRTIFTIYAPFNFSDTSIISNKLYKCSGELTDCTEDISNRVDVVWGDKDGDGSYDFVEWYVTNLTQNQSYQLLNDQGFPIQITETSEILNKPIFAFSNILWRTTITMYNPNAFATTKVYKYEFPLGSADIELDDVSKNLQFDPFGGLAPYLTIVDKSQIGSFPNSVYIAPGETKTFLVTYRTESVTVHASTYFPTYFEVGENALIVQTLRITNQAETDVEDIEHRLQIDYGENLIACEGEFTDGCETDEDAPQYNLTLDTQEEVEGDYTLELANISSGETMYATISYESPTAIVENIEKGRRSVQGVLADYKKVTIISIAPYTMKNLQYKETEIKIENVIDVFKCQIPMGICDIPLVYTNMDIKLGIVSPGEKIEFYIWSIPTGEAKEYESWFDNVWNWFLENVWNGGQKIKISGFLKYILGWLSSTDPTTGELYIPLYRLIFIGSIIGLIIGFIIWIRLRRKKKLRRNRNV